MQRKPAHLKCKKTSFSFLNSFPLLPENAWFTLAWQQCWTEGLFTKILKLSSKRFWLTIRSVCWGLKTASWDLSKRSWKGLRNYFRKKWCMLWCQKETKYKQNQVKTAEQQKKQTRCLDIPAFATDVSHDWLFTSCKFRMLLIAPVQLCSCTTFVIWGM